VGESAYIRKMLTDWKLLSSAHGRQGTTTTMVLQTNMRHNEINVIESVDQVNTTNGPQIGLF